MFLIWFKVKSVDATSAILPHTKWHSWYTKWKNHVCDNCFLHYQRWNILPHDQVYYIYSHVSTEQKTSGIAGTLNFEVLIGLFRTFSGIYDETLCKNTSQPSAVKSFHKKPQHRYLKESQIRVCSSEIYRICHHISWARSLMVSNLRFVNVRERKPREKKIISNLSGQRGKHGEATHFFHTFWTRHYTCSKCLLFCYNSVIKTFGTEKF